MSELVFVCLLSSYLIRIEVHLSLERKAEEKLRFRKLSHQCAEGCSEDRGCKLYMRASSSAPQLPVSQCVLGCPTCRVVDAFRVCVRDFLLSSIACSGTYFSPERRFEGDIYLSVNVHNSLLTAVAFSVYLESPRRVPSVSSSNPHNLRLFERHLFIFVYDASSCCRRACDQRHRGLKRHSYLISDSGPLMGSRQRVLDNFVFDFTKVPSLRHQCRRRKEHCKKIFTTWVIAGESSSLGPGESTRTRLRNCNSLISDQ